MVLYFLEYLRWPQHCFFLTPGNLQISRNDRKEYTHIDDGLDSVHISSELESSKYSDKSSLLKVSGYKEASFIGRQSLRQAPPSQQMYYHSDRDKDTLHLPGIL